MTSAKVTATFGEHHCHALNCTVPVSPKMFMCKTHWYMVPLAMRQLLWKLYVPGQEIRKDPTEAYVKHAMACVNLVADLEMPREGIR